MFLRWQILSRVTDESGPRRPDDREDDEGKRYVDQAPVPSENAPTDATGSTDADTDVGSDTGQPDEQVVGGSHPLPEERESSSESARPDRRRHHFRDETGSDSVPKPPARH